MNKAHRRYALPDHGWAILALHLPGRVGSEGGGAHENHQFLKAVFWIVQTGAPWREFPPDDGNWEKTHRRLCCWRDKGLGEGWLEQGAMTPPMRG